MCQVACGQDHSLFLTDTGKVYACGWGADGQTGECTSLNRTQLTPLRSVICGPSEPSPAGLGHHNVSSSPVEVRGDLAGVEVKQISTYADCSLALSQDGQLYGWGNSEYMQLAMAIEVTQVRRGEQ